MRDTNGTLHGSGRQACCRVPCPFRSIGGLQKGQGLCPYHWSEYANGRTWADQCYPTYRYAVKLQRRDR